MAKRKDSVKVNGEMIRKLRLEKGWDQEHLAVEAGYSKRLVQKLEGGGIVQIETVKTIAETFSVRTQDLLHGFEPYQQGQSVSFVLKDDNASPEDVMKLCDIFKRAMAEYADYKKMDVDSWKQIRVYFITSFDNKHQEPVFFYIVCNTELHDRFVNELSETRNIPDYGIIVARGFGLPDAEMKTTMKYYYGFDHDELAGS
jgi:transcriptional regulator with XRE-family HTH domain